MFRRDADFEAFERVMVEAYERVPLRVLSYCLMSSHWHFIVWPRSDGEVTAFFRWLAHTHAMRWRVAHRTVGYGHLYQGRFKSFPIQSDSHLLTVLRYVERNPLTAGLVDRAERWRWGSLWSRVHGHEKLKAMLCRWPVEPSAHWTTLVNEPLPSRERAQLRPSLERGRPFGTERWTATTARKLGIEHTIRGEGRPKKGDGEARGR